MKVEEDTNPVFGLNHPFNVGLGIPIARSNDDTQGTLTFLFREVKTRNGAPSNKILGLTNKHVVSLDTTTAYEFDGTDPQRILVCADRRFESAVLELKKAVRTAGDVEQYLARNVDKWKKKAELDGGADVATALRRRTTEWEEKKLDITTLQMFVDKVEAEWKEPDARTLGIVEWAPKIAVGVGHLNYTRDIATFAVDQAKLQNFDHNIVDLGAFYSISSPSFQFSLANMSTPSGNQYSATQLTELFWPNAAMRRGRMIPDDLQLPITGVVPYRLVNKPDTDEENGDPQYIVAKYGNTTNLRLGRYSGMEAYISNDLGLESREVAVYNYDKRSDDFAEHGDSGSLISTGSGEALAILHSGADRYKHVTYGTPVWWIIEQIRGRYDYAEFCGITV